MAELNHEAKTSARVAALAIKPEKGGGALPVESMRLVEGYGAEGDAYGGPHRRMVSLLAKESREETQKRLSGGLCAVRFTENITTEGLDVAALRVGDKLYFSGGAVLGLTQVGKACHAGCPLVKTSTTDSPCKLAAGTAFAVVVAGGTVRRGDAIKVHSAAPVGGASSGAEPEKDP